MPAQPLPAYDNFTSSTLHVLQSYNWSMSCSSSSRITHRGIGKVHCKLPSVQHRPQFSIAFNQQQSVDMRPTLLAPLLVAFVAGQSPSKAFHGPARRMQAQICGTRLTCSSIKRQLHRQCGIERIQLCWQRSIKRF